MEEEIWPHLGQYQYEESQLNIRVNLKIMYASNNTLVCGSNKPWTDEQENDAAWQKSKSGN